MTHLIPIEISARHIHVSASDWTTLFGPAELIVDRPISQKPQFVATQRVKLSGPKGEIAQVGIVGPLRAYTQVELSATDAHQLGVQPPLSESGHLALAVPVTITGPVGHVMVKAAIMPRRHIHANPDEAAAGGLINGQEVSVLIAGPRGGLLHHVVVRIDPSFTWRLHLDTDEANALGIHHDDHAEIILE